MDRLKTLRNTTLVLLLIAVFGYVLIEYYSYIFSRKIVGVITAVEKVSVPMAMVTMGSTDPSKQIYSYAVGIKEQASGEIMTASTEDRQWTVAHPGQCVEARFFPYPPWQMDKWGTYHNARLLKLTDCAAP